MRTKDVLFEDFNRVQILCQYLYMDENHYIEVNNGLCVLRIKMEENFRFKCKNMNFPDLDWMDYTETMTIPQIIGIAYRLEQSPAISDYGSRNRWEEIVEITLSNLSLNKHCGGIRY